MTEHSFKKRINNTAMTETCLSTLTETYGKKLQDHAVEDPEKLKERIQLKKEML